MVSTPVHTFTRPYIDNIVDVNCKRIVTTPSTRDMKIDLFIIDLSNVYWIIHANNAIAITGISVLISSCFSVNSAWEMVLPPHPAVCLDSNFV